MFASRLSCSFAWKVPIKNIIACRQIKYSVPLSKMSTSSFNKQVKEFEIPVPYGNIAVKAWGHDKAFPVLALHGWLDNSGIFDRLMPLLSDQFYFIAIDAPGHGKSSHLPPGSMYSDISMAIDLKQVTEFLTLEKFHIIGHSFGGSLALLFSSTFPDLVEKVMLIDVVKPYSVPVDKVPDLKIQAINDLLKINKKLLQSPPVYTSETAPMRLKKGMQDEIDEEGAKILLQRGAKPSACGKGLVFSHDLRCKSLELISIRSHDTVKCFMKKLCCDLQIILANERNTFFQPEEPEMVAEYIDFYQKHLKRFSIEYVDGNHFVHLNNADLVGPIINDFLLN